MRVATGLGAESEPTAEGGGVPGLGSDALARLLDALPIGVGLQDPEGRFFWVNPVLVRQLGMPAEQILGHTLDTLPLERLMRDDGLHLYHVPRVVQGRSEWMVVTGVWLPENGSGGLRVSLFEDVTQTERFRRQVDRLQQALHGQVSTDELTGLLNRRGLMSQLDAQVSRSRRYHNVLSVLVMRLHCLDGRAEPPSEETVTTVARLLRDQTRWPDIIGRWDERDFVLVLPETSAESAQRLSEKLRHHIAELPPVNGAEDRTWAVDFGISEWENGDSAQTLVDKAAAMAPGRQSSRIS